MDMKNFKELRVIVWLLALQLIARGTDYITGNPDNGHGVFPVNEVSPPLMWGIACLVNAVVVMAGLLFRNSLLTRNGAIMCGVTYLSFAVMVADNVFTLPLDDWRFFTSYLVAGAIWLTVAWWLSVHLAVLRARGDNDHCVNRCGKQCGKQCRYSDGNSDSDGLDGAHETNE